MIRKRLLFSVLLIALFSAGCAVNCIRGEGDIISEQRDVNKPFEKISAAGGYEITVSYGQSYSIRVEDYNNLISKLKTEVEGNTLKIYYEDECVNNSKAKIYIMMPKIKELALAGSGDVKILGNMNPVNELKVTLAGSGDIFVNNNFADSVLVSVAGSGDTKILTDSIEYVKVSIAGSGDASLQGKFAKESKISIAGSGDINALDLPTDNVYVSISGSGTAKVFALKSIKVRVSGSGDAYYKGNPGITDFSTSGSGEVHKL